MNKDRVSHNIAPIYDKDSEILILGSFPSVKSREAAFFYHHPQNRFWRVLAEIYETTVPISIEEKKAFLHEHHLAVWDVIESCTIHGSSDASIKDVVPNPIEHILQKADIKAIYVNGKTAEKMFLKYQKNRVGRECTALPSTSPANAAWSVERLVQAWRVLKNDDSA